MLFDAFVDILGYGCRNFTLVASMNVDEMDDFTMPHRNQMLLLKVLLCAMQLAKDYFWLGIDTSLTLMCHIPLNVFLKPESISLFWCVTYDFYL